MIERPIPAALRRADPIRAAIGLAGFGGAMLSGTFFKTELDTPASLGQTRISAAVN